jgi:hypothetical protein
MPSTATLCAASCLATNSRFGASVRHGPHHEPQTLSTTTLPG